MLRELGIYLLGGLTFLPLCLLAAYLYLPDVREAYGLNAGEAPAPQPLASDPALTPEVRRDAQDAAVQRQAAATEAEGTAEKPSNVRRTRAAWLVVRPAAHLLPLKASDCLAKDGTPLPAPRFVAGDGGDGGPDSLRAQRRYMGMVYRGLRVGTGGRAGGAGGRRDGTASPGGAAQEGGMQSGPSTPRGTSAVQIACYAILKAPVLYLYNSDDITRPGSECVAAIDLRQKRVTIWTRDAGDAEGEPTEDATAAAPRPDVQESELFSRRNAIRIVDAEAQWFLMALRPAELEAWYLSLVEASRMAAAQRISQARPVDVLGDVFAPQDMRDMLASLDAVPDPIPVRWLNAMLARIFFTHYRTRWLRDSVVSKLGQRLERVRKPQYLSDVQIEDVDLGRSAPSVSRPMLKTLTREGEASMELGVHYAGAMRITVTAQVNLSLGSRFKTYQVRVVLAVVLRALHGNMLLKIPPPPSNRLWYGFTEMPLVDVAVEPVVSERRVKWSLITGLIRGRILESFAETFVLPNMNDMAFFSTKQEEHRGGVWREAARDPPAVPAAAGTVPAGGDAGTEAEPPHAPGALTPSVALNEVSPVSIAGMPDEAPAETRSAAGDLSSLLERELASAAPTDVAEGTAASTATGAAQGTALGGARPRTEQPRTRLGAARRRGAALVDSLRSRAAPGALSTPAEGLDAGIGMEADEDEGDAAAIAAAADADDAISDPEPETHHVPSESPSELSISAPSATPGSASAPVSAGNAASGNDRFAFADEFGELPPQPKRRTFGWDSRSARVERPEISAVTAQADNPTLLGYWSSKARSSLADRDSRQQAARDAKDALKRGWANWNVRRGGPPGADRVPPRPGGQGGDGRPSTLVLPRPSNEASLSEAGEEPARGSLADRLEHAASAGMHSVAEGKVAKETPGPQRLAPEVPGTLTRQIPRKPVGKPAEELAATESGELGREDLGEPMTETTGGAVEFVGAPVEPTGEPAELAEDPVGAPIGEPAGEPIDELAGEGIREPVGEPANEPVGPLGKLVPEPVHEPVFDPIKEPTGPIEPIGKPSETSAPQSMESAAAMPPKDAPAKVPSESVGPPPEPTRPPPELTKAAPLPAAQGPSSKAANAPSDPPDAKKHATELTHRLNKQPAESRLVAHTASQQSTVQPSKSGAHQGSAPPVPPRPS